MEMQRDAKMQKSMEEKGREERKAIFTFLASKCPKNKLIDGRRLFGTSQSTVPTYTWCPSLSVGNSSVGQSSGGDQKHFEPYIL